MTEACRCNVKHAMPCRDEMVSWKVPASKTGHSVSTALEEPGPANTSPEINRLQVDWWDFPSQSMPISKEVCTNTQRPARTEQQPANAPLAFRGRRA